jgi:hypothetical protein
MSLLTYFGFVRRTFRKCIKSSLFAQFLQLGLWADQTQVEQRAKLKFPNERQDGKEKPKSFSSEQRSTTPTHQKKFSLSSTPFKLPFYTQTTIFESTMKFSTGFALLLLGSANAFAPANLNAARTSSVC